MRSSLRRFVYLVVNGDKPYTWDMHRIDMSRFFSPRSPLTATAAIVDGQLPRPRITFDAPSTEHHGGNMQFMLLGRDKVLGTDLTGRASIYDDGRHALRTAPALSGAKHSPVSIAVGDSRLYVLDSDHNGAKELCFEALVYESVCGPDGTLFNDWRRHSLPAPPCQPADVSACAVVGGGSDLWVSVEEQGTYSFDTAGASWTKKGDWTLPFKGPAHYVPEHKLWFGLSSGDDCSNLFHAVDLAGRLSPPVPRNVWQDVETPKEWLPVGSFLVHLGAARFCIARFFSDTSKGDDEISMNLVGVFTAVEVEPWGKGLRMVKHKSVCYRLSEIMLLQWVL
ncbi:hypothetical protein ACP70R_023635 [Stipagrostis hirtigluma subsp. patula]